MAARSVASAAFAIAARRAPGHPPESGGIGATDAKDFGSMEQDAEAAFRIPVALQHDAEHRIGLGDGVHDHARDGVARPEFGKARLRQPHVPAGVGEHRPDRRRDRGHATRDGSPGRGLLGARPTDRRDLGRCRRRVVGVAEAEPASASRLAAGSEQTGASG